MISKFTWKAYMLVFELGYKFRFFPFRWNSKKRVLEFPTGKKAKLNRDLWRVNMSINLISRAIIICTLFYGVLCINELSIYEVMGAIFFVACNGVSICSQLQVLLNYQNFIAWANGLLCFNSKLGKYE